MKTLIATNSATHYDLMFALNVAAATVTTTGTTANSVVLNVLLKRAVRDLSAVRNTTVADGTSTTDETGSG